MLDVLIVGGVVVAVVVTTVVRTQRMNEALRSGSSGDQCTACDSRNVQQLAPGTYRCNDCGYEGGDGYAAYKEGERAAKFANLSPEQVHEQARSKLLNARSLLLSGIGDAKHAQQLSNLDLVGVGSQAYGGMAGEGMEKHNALTAAVGMMLEAQREMKDVQMMTKSPMFADWVGADMGGVGTGLAAADVHFDNIFADLMAHGRITEVLHRAGGMKKSVDWALETYWNEAPT